jgi:hypothetical protein
MTRRIVYAWQEGIYPLRNKNLQSGEQKISRKTRGNRRPEKTPEFSNGISSIKEDFPKDTGKQTSGKNTGVF